MSQDKAEKIFSLWHDVKKNTQMARDADLPEVEMILRMTGDILVQKYYTLGMPSRRDIQSLIWEDHEWPTQAATFLELKSMLLEATEAEGGETEDISLQQPEKLKNAIGC